MLQGRILNPRFHPHWHCAHLHWIAVLLRSDSSSETPSAYNRTLTITGSLIMRTPFPHCRNYIPILTTEPKKVKKFFGILFFIKHSALSVFLSRIIFI